MHAQELEVVVHLDPGGHNDALNTAMSDNYHERVDHLKILYGHPLSRSERDIKHENFIPIGMQVLYWFVSVICVGLSILDPYMPSPVSIASAAVFLGMAAILHTFKTGPKYRFSFMRCGDNLVRAISLHFEIRKVDITRPGLFSTEPHTFRQVLLIHWCLAFLLMTEYDHWRRPYTRKIEISHPSYRDLVPCCPSSSAKQRPGL